MSLSKTPSDPGGVGWAALPSAPRVVCAPLSPPGRLHCPLCSLKRSHERRVTFISYFQVEALNGMMTSPRTLLCQRQRVTS